MTGSTWLNTTICILFALVCLPALIIAGARESAPASVTIAQAWQPPRTVWDRVYTEEQAQRGAVAYPQLLRQIVIKPKPAKP